MTNETTFNDVLESVDKLSLDEQETLMEVLHRRLIESRRADIAKEIQDAQNEFQQGNCQPADVTFVEKY